MQGAAETSGDPQPVMKTVDKALSMDAEGKHVGRWTAEEHSAFLVGLRAYGREWKKVAQQIKTRTSAQIRSHAQKYFAKLAKDGEHAALSSYGITSVSVGAAAGGIEDKIDEMILRLTKRQAELLERNRRGPLLAGVLGPQPTWTRDLDEGEVIALQVLCGAGRSETGADGLESGGGGSGGGDSGGDASISRRGSDDGAVSSGSISSTSSTSSGAATDTAGGDSSSPSLSPLIEVVENGKKRSAALAFAEEDGRR